MQRIHIIDSPTGGEPTRVVVSAEMDLGAGTLADRRDVLHRRYDHLRSAVVNEARGSDAVVGALICEPAIRGQAYLTADGQLLMDERDPFRWGRLER